MDPRTRSDERTTGHDETAATLVAAPAAEVTKRARAAREDAAALAAQSRQTRRQARALGEVTAVILEQAQAIVREVLQAGGFAVAAPVRARFRTAEGGTTAVEVTLQLEDPAHVDRAAAALLERLGGIGPPDAITVC
jgi:DNA-binding IclR family transcriptional regulator